MPRIESYSFGRMIVDGKEYTRDLVVSWRGVENPSWWRKEGHALYFEDIRDVVDRMEPEALVVGTGYYGFMEVREEVREYLGERGIELVVSNTREACEKFNELVERGVRVVGAFHLTC